VRKHFRGILEDDKVVSTCTRREFRALLTLLKEMFSELASMRLTLNDIILDPSVAAKVSEAAMNPTKGDEADRAKSSGASLGGWMAPIAKLFGTPTSEDKPSSSRATPANTRSRPPFAASKQAPALAASTVAVNVEFTGAGTGRAVSTTNPLPPIAVPARPALERNSSTKGVMGIFAGAPRPAAPGADPWIVVGPRPARGLRSGVSANNLNTTTITRAAGRRMAGQRISRNVDAVIDNESVLHDSDDDDDDEGNTTLLERTLRPRGLSDSSIHSTFLEQAQKVVGHPETSSALPHASTSISTPFDGRPSVRQGAYPNRQSVLASLGKKMHLFKGSPSVGGPSTPTKRFSLSTTAVEAIPPHSESTPATLSSETPNQPNESPPLPIRAISPRRLDILPSLAAWAASTAGLENDLAEEYVGSVQGDSTMHGARSPPAMGRAWSRGREMDFE
jgi:hypothetical protein